jgi:hypothetical protein
MVTMKVQTGLVVFWTLGEFTDRRRLMAAWTAAGLNKAVPEPRANVAVLRDALAEVFAGSRFLVRPLSARTGFAVVREDRGRDENSYAPVLTAKVFGDQSPVYSGDVGKADEVNAAFHRHLGRVTAQQLSAALVKVLYDLGGTRLRPSGSVYWLPATGRPRGTGWWPGSSRPPRRAGPSGTRSATIWTRTRSSPSGTPSSTR